MSDKEFIQSIINTTKNLNFLLKNFDVKLIQKSGDGISDTVLSYDMCLKSKTEENNTILLSYKGVDGYRLNFDIEGSIKTDGEKIATETLKNNFERFLVFFDAFDKEGVDCFNKFTHSFSKKEKCKKDIKKVYISGAITNNPNAEKQFREAEEKYTKLGYEVVNPLKVVKTIPYFDIFNKEWQWKKAMKKDIQEMLLCDAVIMINTPYKSKGAELEKRIARDCGIPMLPYEEEIKKEPNISNETQR